MRILVSSSVYSSVKNVLVMPRDKVFSNKLVNLALPMMLQQLLMSSLFIFDTIFIGGLGDAYISAAGQANNLTMLMWCGYYSVSGTGAIFSAQYWGKDRNQTDIRKAFTASLIFNAVIAVVFFTLAFVFHDTVMSILNPNSGSIRKIGAEYLSIVCFAYPIWAVSSVYAAILRSMGITKKPMVAAVIAMGLNIALDSVFVNGNFGFPKLGVPAAAASTIVGAALELTLLLVFTRRSRSALTATRYDYIRPGKETVRKMLKTALPLTAKDMLWALGIAVYSISFAALGEASIAAYNVYNTMGEFMNVLFISFGGAGGVLIGHVLGAGEIDTAKSYAWRLLRLIFIACVALCPVFILLREVMLLPYPNLSSEAIGKARSALLLVSFIIWAKGINFSNMNGILRSGGDTFGAAAIDIGMLWLVGVPLTFIAGAVLHLDFTVLVAATCVEEFVKVFVSVARVKRYKWVKQLV